MIFFSVLDFIIACQNIKIEYTSDECDDNDDYVNKNVCHGEKDDDLKFLESDDYVVYEELDAVHDGDQKLIDDTLLINDYEIVEYVSNTKVKVLKSKVYCQFRWINL